MRTLQISKISVIPHDKNGNAINVVAIRVGDNKPAILRSFDQFLTDLRESFLIGSDVDSMNDPEVRDVLADLAGGSVNGNISFHKAGDEYTIDENHPAITNQNHRLYGKVVVGQKMQAEKDGARVTDGFLTLKREVSAQAINKSATAYAAMRLKFEGFLNKATQKDAPKVATNVEEFELEEDVKASVVGQ